RIRPRVLRTGDQGTVHAILLPLHRAERGDGDLVCDLRGDGLRGLQAVGLAGDPRVRHVPPARAGDGTDRPRAVHRVRVWHGRGAPGDAEVPGQRHSAVL